MVKTYSVWQKKLILKEYFKIDRMNLKAIVKNIVGYEPSQIPVGTLNEKTRINWIEKSLKDIPKGGRILDAGAGEQPFKKFCGHLDYVSQDFGKYDPINMNTGLQMDSWDYGQLDIVSDIASIPEDDESFDAILCTEVLEHIINPREAIIEFGRLLKKDGKLLLTSPFCSLTHFAPYHYYTGFSKFFYEKELESNGFIIKEIIPNGNYFEYLAQELRRLSNVEEKFTSLKASRIRRRAINSILKNLNLASKLDTGSSELLCYGYHVLAEKTK